MLWVGFLWLRQAGGLLFSCGAWASRGAVVKNPPTSTGDTGDTGLIPGSGRSPGEGNGNPLQYSCLGNLMDRRAWQATAHGVAKSRTRLSPRAHTYSCCGAQALELGLSICGLLTQLPLGMWSPPQLMYPALAGRLSTTGPQEGPTIPLLARFFSLITWCVRGPVLSLGIQHWLWPSAHLRRADIQVGEMDSGQIYKLGCEKCQEEKWGKEEEMVEEKKNKPVSDQGIWWGGALRRWCEVASFVGWRVTENCYSNDSAGNGPCVNMLGPM